MSRHKDAKFRPHKPIREGVLDDAPERYDDSTATAGKFDAELPDATLGTSETAEPPAGATDESPAADNVYRAEKRFADRRFSETPTPADQQTEGHGGED